ncbi:hypothetical protein BLAT2472_40631 [Burkholderia latens]
MRAMPFTKLPHGRYCPASAHLDHYPALAAFEPGCELVFLPFRVLLHPLRVSEHKNVRPRETPASSMVAATEDIDSVGVARRTARVEPS